ncbi:hypothetical protein G7085_12765 [Tessaracoccus sp. HDW20]|uniref:hypothetical protein n=1 Tax=Tessaracoccus coleopterorum TaxID=2714950 RepID=UPI0018D2F458|nr:hypothetical protein [Tessaracoccus coleopterorum]NHB85197.1 hypothetical protein [Tessaracoccus coleopterorum]
MAIGHTKGVLGEESLGDNDIFVAAFSDGAAARAAGPTWVRQLGTSTDDRARRSSPPRRRALAIATTYGRWGEPGGVDVVTFSIDGPVRCPASTSSAPGSATAPTSGTRPT